MRLIFIKTSFREQCGINFCLDLDSTAKIFGGSWILSPVPKGYVFSGRSRDWENFLF